MSYSSRFFVDSQIPKTSSNTVKYGFIWRDPPQNARIVLGIFNGLSQTIRKGSSAKMNKNKTKSKLMRRKPSEIH